MQVDILNKRLKDNKINPTAVRILVLNELINSKIAMSLNDLEIALDSADRVTIYRTLKKFEENRLVHTIEDGTGAVKYAICDLECLCTTEFTHAHFHCTKCNQTYCLRNIGLPEIHLPKNFKTEQSSLILKGICENCNH
jgi:Fur family transcriptional regulator, ferric uptake regulator